MAPDERRSYILYIHNMDDTCMMNRCWVVPQDWIDMLDFCIKKLEALIDTERNQSVESALSIGHDLRDRLLPILCGQIHIVDDKIETGVHHYYMYRKAGAVNLTAPG